MRELSLARHRVPPRRPARACPRRGVALALLLPLLLPIAGGAQVVRGTVSSAVVGGRVPGAVILLLDSALTARARALTSDSGTFTIGAGAPGRFHLRVMHLGFQPTESPTFDLQRDTTVDVALADIPIVLPTLVVGDKRECRQHADSTAAGGATFALWDQARTALLAAAITLDGRAYRFTKLLEVRVYATKRRELLDVGLTEAESEGSAPWVSLTGDQLRRDGYVVEDDSGMTFYAPDLDVLLSPYFTESHCFRLTAATPPSPGDIGIDFEPVTGTRHVEIRGTLWLDAASSELRTLRFTFVNLPVAAAALDTLVGGRVDFTRLTTGAWILPSWRIRMPTPTRTRRAYSRFARVPIPVEGRAHWQLTTDWIRVSGGDVRTVRRNDSTGAVVWQQRTGTVRVFAAAPDSADQPAHDAIVRLAGSPYGGHADAGGHVRFEQLLPGQYLFEVSTPVHDLIHATPNHVAATARAGEVVEAKVALAPLPRAAAEVCKVRALDRDTALLAGTVAEADSTTPAGRTRVTVEWPGGEAHTDTDDDGWFRLCGIPTGKLLLVKASGDAGLATSAITLDRGEIVRQLMLRLAR